MASQAQERQVFWTWVECLNPTSTPETCSGVVSFSLLEECSLCLKMHPTETPLFMFPRGWWQPLESVTFGIGWRLPWWCFFQLHKKHLEQLLLKPEHPALCQRTTVAKLILPALHRWLNASLLSVFAFESPPPRCSRGREPLKLRLQWTQ